MEETFFFQIEKQNKNLSMRTTGKWSKFSDPFSRSLEYIKSSSSYNEILTQ